MREYTNAVNHTRDVITSFERLSNHFKSAQIYSPTYDSMPGREFYAMYKNDALQIGSELTALKTLVKDNADQTKLVDSLSTMISGQIYTLLQKNISELIQSGESWRLNYLFAIHEIINRGILYEKALLDFRDKKLRQSTSFNNLLGVAFALLAVLIIASIFISTVFLSRKRLWLEGFLESVLNTSQNGIVNYKAVRKNEEIVDFKIKFINKAAERILAKESRSFLGKKLKDIPSYVRELNLYEKYIEVTETGNSLTFEISLKKEDKERWFLVSLAKLGDGLTASFQEITQLKTYEAELKNNITQLQRSNNELEQYAYIASHDLQEPLRKIRSFGSYLLETQTDRLDEKGRQHLEKIIRSAERMSVLIKDILSYSSMRKEESFVKTDLNQVLETVLSDFDLSIAQTGAVIKKTPLPVIEAIPLQMNQLFYNLVSNSLKFAGKDQGVEIMITSNPASETEKEALGLTKEAVYHKIIFSDNGIGFKQEYADQIFGLFKRLNDKQNYSGSGIGLALCKKVVENHNGLIYAESRENQGARFFIYLPEVQRVG